jgi:cell volume regulation protein A
MNSFFFGLLDLFRGQIGNTGSLDNFDTSFLLEKFSELQSFVGTLSQEGSIASAPVLLLAAGVIIFLGVAGEAFFKKTGIPDVAFLMILGVIIGPVLGIIQPDAVIQIVPYFAALALIIIMFDGGLNLDLKQIIKTAHFSFTLAILGFILSVVIATIAVHFALNWSWLESILLGSIVGVIS